MDAICKLFACVGVAFFRRVSGKDDGPFRSEKPEFFRAERLQRLPDPFHDLGSKKTSLSTTVFFRLKSVMV